MTHLRSLQVYVYENLVKIFQIIDNNCILCAFVLAFVYTAQRWPAERAKPPTCNMCTLLRPLIYTCPVCTISTRSVPRGTL